MEESLGSLGSETVDLHAEVGREWRTLDLVLPWEGLWMYGKGL